MFCGGSINWQACYIPVQTSRARELPTYSTDIIKVYIVSTPMVHVCDSNPVCPASHLATGTQNKKRGHARPAKLSATKVIVGCTVVCRVKCSQYKPQAASWASTAQLCMFRPTKVHPLLDGSRNKYIKLKPLQSLTPRNTKAKIHEIMRFVSTKNYRYT